MSGNHCSCPKPPGGRVNCAEDQIAYCKVVGGEMESGCLPRPPPNQNGEELEAAGALYWVLAKIGFDLEAPISIELIMGSKADMRERVTEFLLRDLLLSGSEVTAYGRTKLEAAVVGSKRIEAKIRFPWQSRNSELAGAY